VRFRCYSYHPFTVFTTYLAGHFRSGGIFARFVAGLGFVALHSNTLWLPLYRRLLDARVADAVVTLTCLRLPRA